MEISARNLLKSPLATEAIGRRMIAEKQGKFYLINPKDIDPKNVAPEHIDPEDPESYILTAETVKTFQESVINPNRLRISGLGSEPPKKAGKRKAARTLSGEDKAKILSDNLYALDQKHADLGVPRFSTNVFAVLPPELVSKIGAIRQTELLNAAKLPLDYGRTIWMDRRQILESALLPDRMKELKASAKVNDDATDNKIVVAVFNQLKKEARSVNVGELPPSQYEPLSFSAIRELNEFIQNEKDRNFLIFVSAMPGWDRYLQESMLEHLDQKEKAKVARPWFEYNRLALSQTVTELDLADQKMSFLPPEIGELKKLREIDLTNNNLTLLPAEIGNLTDLEELDMPANKLKTLPVEIGKLKNLNYLNLGMNKFETFPQEIGELTSLTWLSLSGNKLKTISPQIGNLVHLQELNLSYNQLENLPEEIGNLRGMERLHLEENKLRSLPTQIGYLIELTTLVLSGNKLENLPAEIGMLKKLTILDLSNNNLENLPGEIGGLIKLLKLYLWKNNLTNLPAEIGDLIGLKKIDIQYNNLRTLPPEIENLKALEVLNLMNNNLENLPATMGGLISLRELNLSKNPQLLPLPEEILNLTSLLYLYR